MFQMFSSSDKSLEDEKCLLMIWDLYLLVGLNNKTTCVYKFETLERRLMKGLGRN